MPLAIAAPVAAETAPVTIAAVGDIACDPDEPAFNDGLGTPAGCQQKAVGDVVRSIGPQAFLALGDLQYLDGTYDKFMAVYDKAFGDLKPITRPIPGNHEYKTARGAGYYQYFGDAAHPQTKGTYSFDLGGWHVLAINSTACTTASPCGPGTPMAKWIAADVANNPSQCLMAMWHHPLWSAGPHGSYAPMLPVWNQLNSYGADVVLNGHDHLYQRSRPLGEGTLNADGTVGYPVVKDAGQGIVEFIVGTGGENNFEAVTVNDPAINAAMAAVDTNPNPAVFGALKMDLADSGYNFQFMPAAGSKVFSEAGSAACRSKTPPTGAPVMPTDISITRAGDGTVDVAWQGDAAPTNHTVRVVGSSRSCSTTANSCRLTGLTNGRSYQVTVTADNPVGTITTEASQAFVPAMKPSRPGVPSATVNGAEVTVHWSATTYDGGLPVQYVVASSTGGYGCTTNSLQCTMTLEPGTYRFSVLTRNEVGDSATQTTATSISVNVPSAPGAPTVERAGDGMVKATLLPASDAATHPIVDYLITSTPASRTCVATLPATSCTVSGLTNGTAYTFTAIARTAKVRSASSAPSAPLIAGRVPVRPSPPILTPAGPGAVTLTWQPTTYDGGLPVTGYEALIGNGPIVACRTAALTCTVTGLTTGSTYWFTVAAFNAAGRSANSSGSATIKAS
jgi:hypothetical protein